MIVEAVTAALSIRQSAMIKIIHVDARIEEGIRAQIEGAASQQPVWDSKAYNQRINQYGSTEESQESRGTDFVRRIFEGVLGKFKFEVCTPNPR
jgi:hypothetical protein